MTDAIAVALITTAGATIGLCLKRWWDVSDHRRNSDGNEREECERYRTAFREIMHYARQLKQSVIAIEDIRHENHDYAMARLTELASEPHDIFERLRDYIAGNE